MDATIYVSMYLALTTDDRSNNSILFLSKELQLENVRSAKATFSFCQASWMARFSNCAGEDGEPVYAFVLNGPELTLMSGSTDAVHLSLKQTSIFLANATLRFYEH